MSENTSQIKSEKWEPSLKRYSACSAFSRLSYRLYTQAGFLFEICTLSDSENQNNYYNLARSLAGSGNQRSRLMHFLQQ